MAKKLYAIIRIRGQADVPPDVEYTLKLLRLHRKYNLVIYPADLPGLEEMLLKVKDWVTWGEVDRATLVELLKRRGRVPGDKPLTDSYIESKLGDIGVKSVESLAHALIDGRAELHKLDEIIKPVFRLHPPRGGFEHSIKKPYGDRGELGYRGPSINDLIKRML